MTTRHALHWIRARQRDLTRVVLALFCLAWLQTAAMPCAMADDVRVAPAHDCAYCPPPAPDANAHEACAYPHGPEVDARAAAPMCVALPATPVIATVAIVADDRAAPPVAVDPGVPRPPVAVTYCRFLF